MTSQHFSSPSPARAKDHQEDLAQNSPQDPILKPEDERFLNKHVADDDPAAGMQDVAASKITDEGEEKEASMREQMKTDHPSDQAVIPETSPVPQEDEQKSYDEIMREKAAERVKARKEKKNRPLDLPSQEEAEAATKGFTATLAENPENEQSEKKTWISFLASFFPASRPSSRPATTSHEQDDDQASQLQKFQNYAAAYVPSLPTSWRPGKDKDTASNSNSRPESPANDTAPTTSTQTSTKQQLELNNLLDKLSLSQINNRVFSFSTETQHIYERFAQVLKDTINGAPTAYEDMDKLFREAGPKLEKQFKAMPPFVQTLVKTLPAKLGATLGPEFLVAASDKPGADMQARMDASGSDDKDAEKKKKKRRRIPGLKALLSKEGAAATMLRNVVNFLQARFPFLASTTSVAMSLAVFILMFVFWYCHKRGKQVRLAKEAEEAGSGEVLGEVDEGFDDTVEEGEGDDEDVDEKGDDDDVPEDNEQYQSMLKDVEEKANMLEQPTTST